MKATVAETANYVGGSAVAEFTIAQKQVTVTADAKTKKYGNADPALTAKVTGLVSGDSRSLIKYRLSRAKGENVGSYAITATGAASQGNYKVSFEGGNLKIYARAVVVTAVDQSVQKGKSIATGVDKAILSGQVKGHVLSAVKLTSSSTSKVTTNGKIKPRAAKIVDANGRNVTKNYKISYVNGKLTVTAPSKSKRKPDYTLLLRAKTSGKTNVVLDWTKVKGADGYDIFITWCKQDTYQLLDFVEAKAPRSYRVTGLKKGKSYKAYVKAWKKDGDSKKYIGKASPRVHIIVGGQSKKHCNAKSVKLSVTRLDLTVGETKNVQATVKEAVSGKPVLQHIAPVRWFSSNANVAKVDSEGNITAVKTGKCNIYALANNGIRAKATVNVQ